MNFQFDARTILELGKELISSNEIALYELIKNSFDAGSPRVHVNFRIRIYPTDIDKAIQCVKNGEKNTEEIVEFLRSQSLVSNDTECEEFICKLQNCKSSLKFEEILENGKKNLNKVIIKDEGEGMSFEDLKSVYLRVGTRNRRRQNEAGYKKFGDKGIGRLSAMRLGNSLTVKTSKRGEVSWNYLRIHWSEFDSGDDRLVQDIEIAPIQRKQKEDPETQGTTITISDLHEKWTRDKFEELVDDNIKRFVDPFQIGYSNKLMKFKFNGKPILIDSIPKELLNYAHATCKAKFTINQRTENASISGSIDYREKQRKCDFEAKDTDIISLARGFQKRRGKLGTAKNLIKDFNIDILKNLGNFELEIYWYNRRIVGAIEGLTRNQLESRREIQKWSGGPMLYRHNIRVLPFGEPDNDWLKLDKVAFGSSGFKLNRQQVIGKVSLNTPHRYLSEQTNREGLIDSPEVSALTNIITWVIDTTFRNFINEVDEKDGKIKQTEIMKNNIILRLENKLQNELDQIISRLDHSFESEVEKIKNTITQLRKETTKVLENIAAFQEQEKNERDKFLYLAGLGLMTESIFHELQRVVLYTQESINKGNKEEISISLLNEQLTTLDKRISAFDALTSAKRQVKTEFDLCELVEDIVSNHSSEYNRHEINIGLDLPKEEMIIYAVKGMFIQIIDNLLANSGYWIKRQKEYNDKFVPEIKIFVDEINNFLLVRDNGPGIPKSQKERIFQPFVSTKPVGMGKGLGLFIAREFAEYNGWELEVAVPDNETKLERLNGFVLRMK